ncbi:uncharacterized protein LOC132195133 [Neocloeon triangulifer]|uniref:uncharacterized protein LOC132195133 n=1 Tax=Neocloeon triangulifer TaxID=2078957 RepID=UPI00286F42B8|nr:uncharacterized protein LOC132195133 [Neocloeon triangulifer]
MNTLVVLSALLACAAAAPGPLLGAPLLPKVRVAPAEVTVVKQQVPVIQHEYVQRDVPVPYPVVKHEVVQPAPIHVPVAPTVYAAAPAVVAAPAAYAAYGAYAAAPLAYANIANPAVVKVY